ncbi:hypothetical protein LTR95_001711 [Oleoguttula sp. CCFEE 5521]
MSALHLPAHDQARVCRAAGLVFGSQPTLQGHGVQDFHGNAHVCQDHGASHAQHPVRHEVEREVGCGILRGLVAAVVEWAAKNGLDQISGLLGGT